MKKRLILVTLLVMLLCLVLAGCGNSPAKVEVKWFAPTPYLSYDKYVWNEQLDGSYYAAATIDGQPAEVVLVVIQNDDTRTVTKMEKPGKCDLEFDDSSNYTVYLWVRLGDNQKTDRDHISAQPTARINIEKSVVCFEWHYDLSEKTRPIMTISIYSPDLEEGWTPVEQRSASVVKLCTDIYGSDYRPKLTYQYCEKYLPGSNGSWEVMGEDEVFERGYLYQLCFTIDSKLLKEIPNVEAFLKMECTGGTWEFTGGYSDGLFRVYQTYDNLTVDPVNYNLSVNADTPKLGMSVEEASELINLIDPPEGISKTVSWSVHVDGHPWRKMDEEEVLAYNPAIDREYVATIDILVPNDYNERQSYVTVQAPGASDVYAPMLSCANQRKHILVDVVYPASNLIIDPNSVELTAYMDRIYLGDSIQAAGDNISVFAYGQPVKVTHIDLSIEDIYGREWDFAPAWSDTFETTVGGSIPVRYYIFRLYLEDSELTDFDNLDIDEVLAWGYAVEYSRTSVSRGDPNSEHPGTVITAYLDTNRMRNNYDFQGTVDVNLNLASPHFGESVGQWIHDFFNYAYTSIKVYTPGEEMDITVSAVKANGSETLSEDYILKQDADIPMYVMRVVLHESGLIPGEETKLHLVNEERVSSWQCSNVQENGDIIVDVVYAVSKINEGKLEYNAYSVPAGSTVAAIRENLPNYAMYYIPNVRPAVLDVTQVQFRKDFSHRPMFIPDDPGMGDEERFLVGGDYCMEVTLLMTREELDGLDNHNVSSQFTRFEVGPIIGFEENDMMEVHLFLYFKPMDMGTCQHSFTYEFVDGKTPTCTEEGKYKITCTLCGYSYTEVAPATDHDMKVTDKKAATCTEGGYTRYTCKNCGETYTVTSNATGHSTDWTGDNYWHWLACKKCGYEPPNRKIGSHEWNGEDGVEVYVNGEYYYRYRCAICDRNYDKLIVN